MFDVIRMKRTSFDQSPESEHNCFEPYREKSNDVKSYGTNSPRQIMRSCILFNNFVLIKSIEVKLIQVKSNNVFLAWYINKFFMG